MTTEQKETIKVKVTVELELDAKNWEWYQRETGAEKDQMMPGDISWAFNGMIDSLREYDGFYGSWRESLDKKRESKQ